MQTSKQIQFQKFTVCKRRRKERSKGGLIDNITVFSIGRCNTSS